jgi:hypothetical protein
MLVDAVFGFVFVHLRVREDRGRWIRRPNIRQHVARFNEGLQTRVQRRPAEPDAAQHLGIRPELIVRHGQAHALFERYEIEADARALRGISDFAWIRSRYHEAPRRIGFEDRARDADVVCIVVVLVPPRRSDVPV